MTIDHQLVEVRQGESCAAVEEVVEPVVTPVGGLRQTSNGVLLGGGADAFKPSRAGCCGHAVEGLHGGQGRAVAPHDLFADFLLQPKHDVLHLAFQDVDDCEITLVRGLLDCAENDWLREVRVLEFGSLKGVSHCHAHRLEAVGKLGNAGVVPEDDRLLDAETARDLHQVARALDGAEEGMAEERVVNQLVAQELQRGADDALRCGQGGLP